MQSWGYTRAGCGVGLAIIFMIQAFAADPQPELPPDILSLFHRLDALGVPSLEKARYVELDMKIVNPFGRARENSEIGWLLAEDDKTLTVLQDDLLPMIYNKLGSTTIPSSWSPTIVKSIAVRSADFAAILKDMSIPAEKVPEGVITSPRLSDITPRFLAAYAAWQKGYTSNSVAIIQGDWNYQYFGSEKYTDYLWEDLAARHFLRGVNLLMFADRKEAIDQLKLSIELAPSADFGEDRQKLIDELERIVRKEPVLGLISKIVPTAIGPFGRAYFYASQLKDAHCIQMGQPAGMNPFESSYTEPHREFDADLPTTQLAMLGAYAVPVLILAANDDSPTRTVHHWRDFARNRKVWKVSDLVGAIWPVVAVKIVFDVVAFLIVIGLLSLLRSAILYFRSYRPKTVVNA